MAAQIVFIDSKLFSLIFIGFHWVSFPFPGDDERMSVLHQDSGWIGKSIPSALEISLDPREILGVRDGFPIRSSLSGKY